MKVLKGLAKFLFGIWQLPQWLVGLVSLLIYKSQKRIIGVHHETWSNIYIIDRHPSGVSYGPVIFVREDEDKMKRHELGHAVQSRMLGPLYLIVVGLPSLYNFLTWNPTHKKDYYELYPENWADRLGGVKRK